MKHTLTIIMIHSIYVTQADSNASLGGSILLEFASPSSLKGMGKGYII